MKHFTLVQKPNRGQQQGDGTGRQVKALIYAGDSVSDAPVYHEYVDATRLNEIHRGLTLLVGSDGWRIWPEAE